MSAPKTYMRPMAGWWQRNPFYRTYILRETTCVAIIVYAVILLVGLWRLSQGPEAFAGWLASLSTTASVVLHVVLLALVGYHAWTWFEVMPKTMPFIFVGGRRVADRTIVTTGAAAAVLASIVVWLFFWWAGR